MTRIVGGACVAVKPGTNTPIPEAERVAEILAQCRPAQDLEQSRVSTIPSLAFANESKVSEDGRHALRHSEGRGAT